MVQLALIVQLKEQLNLLMGVEKGIAYEVQDSIPFRKDIALGVVLDSAMRFNPQLNLTSQNIEVARLTLRERRAERFPTLNFNSAYNFNRSSNQTVLNNFTPYSTETQDLITAWE